MTLLLTMLPVYFLANFHCLGMCGPLMMMIGKNRYRYYYFAGRAFSYSLVGAAAGAFGAVLNIVLHTYQIPAATSIIFGSAILFIGIGDLLGWKMPNPIGRMSAQVSERLTLLLLRDRPLTTFLFGFFTVMLPCGQTLIVFSACALSGSMLIGFLNALVFALISSPSLWFAMHMHGWIGKLKQHYTMAMGLAALFVGAISIARGLAEMDVIEHLSYEMTEQVHLVVY